jgi:Asp-tRNA(Asn)/Glu-tRNA(Gln) amidotransferase A subunit family amidase
MGFTSITATEPAQLTASAAAALIRTKQLSCEELVRSCLARIAARDAQVKAWLWIDPDHVVRRARELDKLPEPKGPLHGLPFGVKDVIDTADYPTTHNSPIYDGLRMGKDAAPVAVVRGSGALILGKTDTVEFASGGRKALTRNPYNPLHTRADRPPVPARRSATFRCRWRSARRPADRTSGRRRSTAFMA